MAKVQIQIEELIGPVFQLVTGLVSKTPTLPVSSIAKSIADAFDFPEIVETFDDDIIEGMVVLALSIVSEDREGASGRVDVATLLGASAKLAGALADRLPEGTDLKRLADEIDLAIPLPWPWEAVDGFLIHGALKLGLLLGRKRREKRLAEASAEF